MTLVIVQKSFIRSVINMKYNHHNDKMKINKDGR